MGDAPLVADSVSAAFDNRVVLQDVSLTLQPGTLTALVGANGAGKSTLLHLLQGQLAPTAGRVLCDGVPVQTCRDQVVLMPQRGRIDWSFPITVREFVDLGSVPSRSYGCCDRDAAKLYNLNNVVKSLCRFSNFIMYILTPFSIYLYCSI